MFKVHGVQPDLETIRNCIQQYEFTPIDGTVDAQSIGFVPMARIGTSFEMVSEIQIDEYLAFSLRKDVKRVPGTVIKAEMKKATTRYLTENPDKQTVPKAVKNDLREAILQSLYQRSIPSPTILDIVWDLSKKRLYFTNTSPNAQDMLQSIFRSAFSEHTLSLITPLDLARDLLKTDDQRKLALMNFSKTPDDAPILDKIHDNRWIGHDFLLWMVYRTDTVLTQFQVKTDGPIEKDTVFYSGIGNRLSLINSEGEAAYRVTITGEQDGFCETKSSLRKERQVSTAQMFLVSTDEIEWNLNLDSSTFQVSGFKIPQIRPDMDPEIDPMTERQTLFLLQLAEIECGIQQLQSVFFEFLTQRLSSEWSTVSKAINKWLADESLKE
jgi:hypothetical protein